MINRVGKMCVAAMSLCMNVLIVTGKRGDGWYHFALWQSNNTPNELLLSESVVNCHLRVRSVSFTSRAKGCIKFLPHSCLVSLSHKVGVFLEEAICYFINAKFAVMLRLSINWKSIKKNVFLLFGSIHAKMHYLGPMPTQPLRGIKL
jgi:hypothetical protein